MEGDDWQCPENLIDNGNSQFREEVMGILKRPYSQDEFDELLQDVNVRKPIGGRNSCRRSRSFSANKCSKSYLDQYTGKLNKANRFLLGITHPPTHPHPTQPSPTPKHKHTKMK